VLLARSRGVFDTAAAAAFVLPAALHSSSSSSSSSSSFRKLSSGLQAKQKTSTTSTTSSSNEDDFPKPAAEPPKTSGKPRPGIDASMLGDLTGGRAGAVIETEEQLERKQEFFDELDQRGYDEQLMKDYGELQEDEEAEWDIDDPDALDSGSLGQYTIKDLQSKFSYEWHPEDGEPDPNFSELAEEGVRFKDGVDIDEEGIEVGYDPMFGPSNPMDERTILGAMDSYMIDERTKNDAMLPPVFPKGDLEIDFNQDVVKFRKSLDIIETYADEFYTDREVPRHVAKWHGYPEVSFEQGIHFL
jgi:hypothetical protein